MTAQRGHFPGHRRSRHDHPAADQRRARPRMRRASSAARADFRQRTICRSTCPRSNSSGCAAASRSRTDHPRARPHRQRPDASRKALRDESRAELPFPPGRGGDDVPAAVARAGARHPAQAIDLGARHLRVDRDGGRPITRSTNMPKASARCGRVDPVIALWVPFALFAALDLLDVLDDRVRPRRPADRRARTRRGQGGRGDRRTFEAPTNRAGDPPDMAANSPFSRRGRSAFTSARLFLTRMLAVLLALVLVLQTLDLLGESGKILDVAGNERRRCLALCRPARAADHRPSLPFSVLLGTIVTLATLNQNSEVVSMKAAGLSAHQVLAPLFLASVGRRRSSRSRSTSASSRAPPRRSIAGRRSNMRRFPREQTSRPTSGCATATI